MSSNPNATARSVASAFLAFLLVWAADGARAEILGNYLGHEACRQCHQDLVAGWKTTRHATAFEDLKTQGPEKQAIPGCFRCHVVGFEQDGGFIDQELTPELRDVQCEACHGPGRAHAERQGDKAAIVGRPGEASCRACHTEGQDRNFDFAAKRRLVHGANK